MVLDVYSYKAFLYCRVVLSGIDMRIEL